ncbi:class I SAM-dependent methyltransferase [Endozoicomonas arenosclerae]|uniref:class I SAM-dependent methyltransferase n=1 Tax=Endozoicomonas arenosclerae TaxID=1633495 RepID=UPI00078230C5|nr:class I SAM-dependent methyltransferase [Endozoicomonas arenosclerae]
MSDLIEQYTNADEDLRLVRQNITRLEFDTTLHLMEKYIQPGSVLTEVGAATGRYSLHYAAQGNHVTAVELAPDQVEIISRKAREQQIDLRVCEGSAVDLSFIDSESQDIVLILGPLYHLQELSELQQAMEEAFRVLKPGGIVAVAYISRHFVAGLFAQHFPELITPEVLNELSAQGCVSHEKADRFFRVGYFCKPEEIEHLVTDNGFELLEHAATDGYGRYIRQSVNEFDEATYQNWLQYHFSTCREPSLLGSSNHGLVIARKN